MHLQFVRTLTSVRNLRFSSLAAALIVALSGCAVGPNFERPNAPATARVTTDPLPSETVAAPVPNGDAQRFLANADVSATWWTAFGSDELNRRVTKALAHSPTVASAQAALRQAQANVDATRGSQFPKVDVGAGATRTKSSAAAFGVTAPGQSNVSVPPYTLYNASVDVSYTLDLFGGVRRSIEGQSALADYAAYQLEGTYLTLASNVATASFQEASLRAQIAATDEIAGLVREQLDLTQKQVDIGVKAEGDLLFARSQLASVLAGLPTLRQQLDQTRTQLAVYLGDFPADNDLAVVDLDAVSLPIDVPSALPSQLVEQRPDVRAAEAQLHQATASVGIATANLLPQLTLTGSLGSQALSGSDLFKSGGEAWSLGLNLLQPIFHGGTLRAQKRAAEAGLDKASADYRNTVLNAFKNVADTLRALELDAEALRAQAEFQDASSQSLELVRTQFKLGAANYLQLLDAQRQYQQARINVVDARAARLRDTAALFTALGGGWKGDTAAIAVASAPSPAAPN